MVPILAGTNFRGFSFTQKKKNDVAKIIKNDREKALSKIFDNVFITIKSLPKINTGNFFPTCEIIYPRENQYH